MKNSEKQDADPYTLKPTHTAILLYLMDQIYRPRFAASGRMYQEDISGEKPGSHKCNFEYDAYLGTTENKPFNDSFYQRNDVCGIMEFFDGCIGFHGIDTARSKPPFTEESIRKMLQNDCRDGLLRAVNVPGKICNRKRYFPCDDKERFQKFLGRVEKEYDRGNYETYSELLTTRFMELNLNRQFVLDYLKDHVDLMHYNMQFPMELFTRTQKTVSCTGYDATKEEFISFTFFVKIPLAGRFLKTYEKTDPVKHYKVFCENLKKLIDSGNLSEILALCRKYNAPCSELFDLEKSEKYSRILDKLIEDLGKDIDARKSVKRFVEELENSKNNKKWVDGINGFFAIDPDGTYRMEDPWSNPVISDEEYAEIDKLPVTWDYVYKLKDRPCTTTDEKMAIFDTIYCRPGTFGFSEMFDREDAAAMIEELVSAITCLIQFSPKALFYLVGKKQSWKEEYVKKEIFKEDEEDVEKEVLNIVGLTNRLTKLALTDYLNETNLKPVFPRKCVAAGNDPDFLSSTPTVLSFSEGNRKRGFSWCEEPISKRPLNTQVESFQNSIYKYGEPYDQRLVDIVQMLPSYGTTELNALLETVAKSSVD